MRPVDTVKLYFYSNKAFGAQGNTYREPSAYTVQYHDGSAWRDVPGQVRSPAAPAPNYNRVDFPDVMAQRLRVLVTRDRDVRRRDQGAAGVPQRLGDAGAGRRRRDGAGHARAHARASGAVRRLHARGRARVLGVDDRERGLDRRGRRAERRRPERRLTPGHLVNGSFFLPQPLRARALNAANSGTAFNPVPLNLLAYDGPISNDAVTLQFRQSIGANDALRTGTYGKTLTFTLSTTNP